MLKWLPERSPKDNGPCTDCILPTSTKCCIEELTDASLCVCEREREYNNNIILTNTLAPITNILTVLL